MLLNVMYFVLIVSHLVSNNLSFFSAESDMMCWGGLEQLITQVNSVIYTSKLKVFAKLHKESEIRVQK